MHVGRKKPEGCAVRTEDGTKVTLVEGEDVCALMAMGEHHQGGVGESEAKVGVGGDDGAGRVDVLSSECLQFVRAASHVIEHGHLGVPAASAADEVVEFREDEGRQDAALRSRENPSRICMVMVAAVVVGK